MLWAIFYTLLSFLRLTTNRRPSPYCCFFAYFSISKKKEYQTESKRNETFGSVIFGTNLTRRAWSASQEAPEGPLSRGPLGRPPTYFFLLYIPMYPENIQGTMKHNFHRSNLLYP